MTLVEALATIGYFSNYYVENTARKENESMEKILMDRLILQPSSFSLKNDDKDMEKTFLNAQRTLRVLGAFDSQNRITEIGEQMALLPINVYSARMLVEAQKLGVADDVMTIVSCIEVGGLKHRKSYYSDFGITERSDLLSELALFKLIQSGKSPTPFGLLPSHFERAMDIRNELDESMYDIYGSVNSEYEGEKERILRACLTGLVDFVYIRGEHGWYTNPLDPCRRKLNLMTSSLPEKYVMGIPQNIPLLYDTPSEQVRTLFVINYATSFSDPQILYDIAPQLVEKIQRNFFHFDDNTYRTISKTFFNEVLVEETSVEFSNSVKRIDTLLNWFVANTLHPLEGAYPEELQEIFSYMVKISSNEEELGLCYMKVLRKTFGSGIPNLTKKKNLKCLLENVKKISVS